MSFKAVQKKIATRMKSLRGTPPTVAKREAGAILAAATRRASPAAKRANPKLRRVK